MEKIENKTARKQNYINHINYYVKCKWSKNYNEKKFSARMKNY